MTLPRMGDQRGLAAERFGFLGKNANQPIHPHPGVRGKHERALFLQTSLRFRIDEVGLGTYSDAAPGG